MARQIVLSTFAGTAALAKERDSVSLGALRKAVTSKKGTTFAGFEAMKKAKVKAGLTSGLEAAYKRAVEISKNLQRGGK